ncbi:MAG: tetratricopeptide repeat protein [Pseudomonadota bacterium]|nr:tetratricopeptide repeat protein [Pseudomonadota bacterium]MEC8501053.1 tetratricopeptide repeat protein [Pseudomonadota bacterium]MEC8756003.1 tetratricopeptide repeat protein [Pseudomonadota bacterium]
MQTPIAVTVTVETFQTEVVDRSQSMPVVVLFWAEQVPPSVQTKALLETLLDQYAGKFALALSDVATDQNLAQRLQVPGLPCIRVVHKGQIVDQLDGPAEEQQLRAILDQHTQSLDDAIAGDLQQVLERGDFETATRLLQAAIEEEPNNQSLRVDLADVLVRKGDLEDARTVLASIKDDTAERQRPQTRLEFLEEAAGMPTLEELLSIVASDDADLEAKYQLAVRHVAAEEYEQALLVSLDILRADREFREDLGRTTMIRVFEVLGKGNELAGKYRRKMFNLMH